MSKMIDPKPSVRNNVSLSVNPMGLKQNVKNQVNYVKEQGSYEGPKKVLIIGASSSYGLGARISLAFGAGADTIGVSYEKGPKSARNLGTAGWYNNIWFKEEAEKEGLIAKNFVQDAFSNQTKEDVINYIKEEFGGQVDLVVYSLASGVRHVEAEDKTYRSAIKAIGEPVIGSNIDVASEELVTETVEPASEEEIHDTVKVMGGEDWKWWMEALLEAGVLAEGAKTLNFGYIGSVVTYPFYFTGTLGRAKADVDVKAKEIDKLLKPINGSAAVAVCRAVVTKASSVIPLFSPYCIALFKVMKEKGTQENEVMHQDRLFRDMVYGDGAVWDDEGRLRPDNWELDPETQEETIAIVNQISPENFKDNNLTDFPAVKKAFYNLSGFMVDGYEETPVTVEELKALEF